MRFSLFISRRVRHNPSGSFSATVYVIGVAGVAIGIIVAILTFAVLFGYKDAIQQKVFLFGSHMRLTKLISGNSLYDEAPIAETEYLNRTFAEIPELTRWQGIIHKSGVLKTPSEMKGVIFKGVGKDYDWERFRSCLVDGDLPDLVRSVQDTSYTTEVVISSKISRELMLSVGDKVLMYFVQSPPRVRNLTVVGIYETGLVEEFDDKMLIGDIGLLQRINNWDPSTVGSYELYIRDFADLDNVYRKVYDEMPPDLFLVKITDLQRLLFEWLKLMDTNTTVLITLVLIVACFNMISVLLIMIMERTPMIGLLKTLGSSNQQIRQIFFNIGLHILWKGLLYGNLIGISLCLIQKYLKIVPLDPVNYFVDTVPILIDWPTIAWINLATIVIVGLIILIPTSIISRIQPVKALIFKK
ncbi:MAG: FtsX-like permease family protein [Spirosomataceae bacterium]